MNRSACSIFVIGDLTPDCLGEIQLNLRSDDESTQMNAWKSALSSFSEPIEVPFIGEYTKYVKRTSPIDLASFKILNTSPLNNIGGCSVSSHVLNLNGLIHVGIDKSLGVAEKISCPSKCNEYLPTFSTLAENYAPLAPDVAAFEEFVEYHGSRSIFFIGADVRCQVTESLFNRAIVRATIGDPIYICVVSERPSYMDDLADLVVRAEGARFLEHLNSEFERVEGFGK